jgi:undecaprenyl-diphosphatase
LGAVDEFMRFCADYLIYGSVLMLAALWFHRAGLRAGLAVGLGALLALALGQLLGSVIHESRPFVVDHFTPLVAHSADGSFPSDHLLVLGAVGAGCAFASRRLAAAAAVLAILVAVARVYVGIHYPVDVVAGFVIGAVCGTAVWYALRPLQPALDRVDVVLCRYRLRRVRVGGAA